MLERLFHRWMMVLALLAGMLLVPEALAVEDYLQPDEAFQFSTRMADGKILVASFRIADAYYLYRERFKFSADMDGQNVALGEPVYPKGGIKFDETFQKDVEYYRTQVEVPIPLLDGTPHNFNLNVTYQGCADAGLCYAPIEKTAKMDLAAYTSVSGGEAMDQSPHNTAMLQGGNLLTITAVLVGIVLLLAIVIMIARR